MRILAQQKNAPVAPVLRQQARYTANSTAVLQRMRSEDVGHVPSRDATGVKTTTEAGER